MPSPKKKATKRPAKKKAAKRSAIKDKVASLRIMRKSFTELKPHPRNPREHPEPGTPEWETLKASLKHDYFDPLIWNDKNGMLVSGHLRRKIMMAEGFTGADVVVVSYDEGTHLGRMIAANKPTGRDNPEALKEIFVELKSIPEFNITGVTAFSNVEVDQLLPMKDEADFDDNFDYGEGEDEEGVTTGTGTGVESSIKYLQLVYSMTDYLTFQELLETMRSTFQEELEERFGEEGNMLHNVVMLAFEKLTQD